MASKDLVKGYCKESKCAYDVYTKEKMDELLEKKQGSLTFDDTPIENSSNPVKSGGVYDSLLNVYSKAESDAKYFIKGNIAVLTGTISNIDTDTNTINGVADYPEGFNQNNCVVLSSMFRYGARTDSTYTYGYNMSSMDALYTADISVRLYDINIGIQGRSNKVPTAGGEVIIGLPENATYDYKIVLMKIN